MSEVAAINAAFKRVQFFPAAHGLAAFAFAPCGWNGAVQSNAAFAESNSSLPLSQAH
jgi:hypothetical protein